jgi:hypothetical protein
MTSLERCHTTEPTGSKPATHGQQYERLIQRLTNNFRKIGWPNFSHTFSTHFCRSRYTRQFANGAARELIDFRHSKFQEWLGEQWPGFTDKCSWPLNSPRLNSFNYQNVGSYVEEVQQTEPETAERSSAHYDTTGKLRTTLSEKK